VAIVSPCEPNGGFRKPGPRQQGFFHPLGRMEFFLMSALPISNIEGERALLGVLLIDNSVFEQIGFLDQSDFSTPAHQAIFHTCCGIITGNSLADPCTVQSHLPAELDGIPTAEYLELLTRDACISVGAVSYAKLIKELAKRRQHTIPDT